MNDQIILSERDSTGVAIITLNKPDIHNAFNDVLISKLKNCLDDVAAFGVGVLRRGIAYRSCRQSQEPMRARPHGREATRCRVLGGFSVNTKTCFSKR